MEACRKRESAAALSSLMQNFHSRQKHASNQKANGDVMDNVHIVVPTAQDTASWGIAM
jgi:hypothetical protein